MKYIFIMAERRQSESRIYKCHIYCSKGCKNVKIVLRFGRTDITKVNLLYGGHVGTSEIVESHSVYTGSALLTIFN